MPVERKKVLYGERQEGKRSQGDKKIHYKDNLKDSLKDFNIPRTGNMLHRIEQSGVALSEKHYLSTKQRESMKVIKKQ